MKKQSKKEYKEHLLEELSPPESDEQIEREGTSQEIKQKQVKKKPDENAEIVFDNRNPFGEANFFQKLFFLWPFPLWKTARKYGKLKIDQLGNSRTIDTSEVQTMEYIQAQKGKQSALQSYIEDVLKQYRLILEQYTIGAFLIVFKSFMTLLTPYFLYELLKYLEDPNDHNYSKGLLLIFGMLFTQYGEYLFSEHQSVYNDIVGRRGRIALMGVITEKTLKISPSAEKTFTQGQILNRSSVDASKIHGISQKIGEMLSLPIMLTVSILSLYKLIGWSFLAGMTVFIFMIVFTLAMARWMHRIQKEIMKASDQRMEITTQVIHSMKTIKMASWERDFEKKIQVKRENQLKLYRKRQKVAVLNHVVSCLMPFLISITSFGMYMYLGNELSPSITYTVVMMFNIMRGPLNSLPWIISQFIETFVSIKRIEEFLLQEDVDRSKIHRLSHDAFSYALAIQNASFAWKMKQGKKEEKKKN